MSRILTNEMMKQHLNQVENMPPIKDNNKIQKFLDPEFINWDGCILLAGLNNENDLGTHFKANEYYPDRTGYEAFYNHIHLIDYFPEFEECPIQSLMVALSIVKAWEIKLKRKFPCMTFHIVLSYDENGCVLRFYRYRIKERSWINIDHLEGYAEESLMVIMI